MCFLKFLLAALLLCCLAPAQTQNAPQSKGTPPQQEPEQPTTPGLPKLLPGFDIHALNTAAQPCQDFYEYACGNWLKLNPIPADKSSYGRFTELFDRNREVLHQILEKYSNPKNQTDAVEQKIGDYYASCMDEQSINAKGLAPLQPELDRIAAIKTQQDLVDELAHLHSIGVDVLFSIGPQPDFKNASQEIAAVYQDGIGLPERDFYFKDDKTSQDQRNQYVEHVKKMFELLGDKSEDSSVEATTVMAIETQLAHASLKAVELRDPSKIYHKETVDQLAALSPAFDWKRYLADRHLDFTDLNVGTPEFVSAMQPELTSIPISDWKTYLRWHLIGSQALALPKQFDEETFNFYGKVLRGTEEQEPRWKRCVSATDGDLGEALGQKYVELTFGAEGKARTMKMIDALQTALKEDIENLPWMTPETKKQALVKLAAITRKIGYPDKWRDYSALNIVRGDALGNSFRANAFEDHRQLTKIGKPVDRKEWGMTPPTVNAYYNPLENNINFPAGILQPPFFDKQIDDAVNFGGIGAVIGHEMTHGFDDQGSQFDPDGNLKNWWTPADKTEFDKRTACIADEYSGFTAYKDPQNPKNDVNLNGRLTLGENTADNGGLRIAYMALENTLANQQRKKIDGFTPEQRLFLGWAQVWCTNTRPQSARTQALTNPHSLPEFRVNGVVSNMPEFEKAYSCKAGDPMVRANACRVW